MPRFRRPTRSRPTAGSGLGDSLPAVGRKPRFSRCRSVAQWRGGFRGLVAVLSGVDLACGLLHRRRWRWSTQLIGGEVGCLAGHSLLLVGDVRRTVKATGDEHQIDRCTYPHPLAYVVLTDGDGESVAAEQANDP